MIEVNLNNLHPLQTKADSVRGQLPTADACAKVILTGEHAVVYGAHALAIPVTSMGIRLSLKRLSDGSDKKSTSAWMQEEANGPELHIGDQRLPQHIETIVSQACDLLAIKDRNFMIRGHSSLLVGAGVGSSAALCVCLLRLLAQAFDISLSHQKLSHYANELEKYFHGSPSGLDTAVVSYGQPIIFKKDQPNVIRNINVQGSFHFVLIDSHTRSATKLMIEKAAPFFTSSTSTQLIKAFDHVTMEAAEALATNNFGLLATAMNRNCELLRQIGVVDTSLEKILSVCQELGVPASKPTGAGGGGCVLALLPEENPDTCLIKLKQKLSNHNIIPIIL